MSRFEQFILWLYRIERDIKFKRAQRKCHFSDCAGAYEDYRAQKKMLLEQHKIMF